MSEQTQQRKSWWRKPAPEPQVWMERLPLDTEILLDDGRWVLAATYPQYDASKHYEMRSGNVAKIAELQAWKEAEQSIIMQNAQLLVAAGCKYRIPDAIKELVSEMNKFSAISEQQASLIRRMNAQIDQLNKDKMILDCLSKKVEVEDRSTYRSLFFDWNNWDGETLREAISNELAKTISTPAPVR